MLKISKILLTSLFLLTSFAHMASAGIVLITDRTSLGGTDYYDWALLGGTATPIPSGTIVTSNNGLQATLSIPSGDMIKTDQQPWLGNFSNNTPLLSTNGNSGPLTVDFNGLVSGAGAQIQWDAYGAFTAEIKAFDNLGGLLASYFLDGSSTSVSNNSAIFIGLLSDSLNIAMLTFNVTNSRGFVINQLDVTTSTPQQQQQPPTPTLQVPEPGIFVLFSLGLLAMGTLVRRREV
ncbi:MAG: PEP-CTERM sorting domain-containing protein [Emcibacter sp.]|nr:PEP-CTERM sorting domain-containing protein [Emcibacter sp.]